ncbi:MAG: hypothetical protein V4528_06600 [Pseudomonadota bacterium]
MAKNKRPVESVSGSYTPLPHAVLDSVAFMGAGITAKALLFELLRQHNGSNNGRLQLTSKWLARRCWRSADVVLRARGKLIERGLIVQTRQGGLNHGASQYGLTWLPITNFVGLDIAQKDYHPGAWRFMDQAPTLKNTSADPAPVVACYGSRSGADPAPVAVESLTTTADVARTPLLRDSTTTSYRNNECYQLHPGKTSPPIVGKKGKSGKPGAIT